MIQVQQALDHQQEHPNQASILHQSIRGSFLEPLGGMVDLRPGQILPQGRGRSGRSSMQESYA